MVRHHSGQAWQVSFDNGEDPKFIQNQRARREGASAVRPRRSLHAVTSRRGNARTGDSVPEIYYVEEWVNNEYCWVGLWW